MLFECVVVHVVDVAYAARELASMLFHIVCLQTGYVIEYLLANFAAIAILLLTRIVVRLKQFNICCFEIARHAFVNLNRFALCGGRLLLLL